MNAKLKQAIDEAYPGPSQDPADYEMDVEQVKQTLFYLKQRFVARYGEELWRKSEPEFQKAFLSKDPDIASRFRGIMRYKPLQRDFGGAGAGESEPEGLGQGLEQQALDTDPEYKAQRAAQAEPSLRRGESLVQRVIGKLNG